MHRHRAQHSHLRRFIAIAACVVSSTLIGTYLSVGHAHPGTAASRPAPVVPIDMPFPLARSVTSAAASHAVRYTFDGGAGDLSLGAGGEPALTVSTARGGRLVTVRRDAGDAIAFPARCAKPGAASCPRAILQTSGDVSALNPDAGGISYGATVRMTRAQTSDGANVVQKGFATGGSEYKLQVDGDAGKPSCAVVGTANDTIYLARASISIADGNWHVLACELRSLVLTITVDGVVRGTRSVAAGVVIANSDPIRIGGKGTSANNDQFNGALDDVWITVGS